MINILLMSDTGVSPQMLAQKMRDEAQARGIDASIECRSVFDYRECAAEYDAALLAPQSRHHLRECQQSAAAAGKPLACIDPDMFWDLQSAAVLDLALSLLKNPA
ncbi:PTS sugar transporter subunit IIB [Morganella morganii]|uniref:PTS sugar transporter subunit IIB n=2 Tax=Morganella morganii TaxID=582 RepID=UPI0021D03EC5|nr:PTS sugar transporter subunit IIB [Morganella morganii]MCU6375646.1 PTS sugar transporter subunit IIB [Morganella morganii]